MSRRDAAVPGDAYVEPGPGGYHYPRPGNRVRLLPYFWELGTESHSPNLAGLTAEQRGSVGAWHHWLKPGDRPFCSVELARLLEHFGAAEIVLTGEPGEVRDVGSRRWRMELWIDRHVWDPIAALRVDVASIPERPRVQAALRLVGRGYPTSVGPIPVHVTRRVPPGTFMFGRRRADR